MCSLSLPTQGCDAFPRAQHRAPCSCHRNHVEIVTFECKTWPSISNPQGGRSTSWSLPETEHQLSSAAGAGGPALACPPAKEPAVVSACQLLPCHRTGQSKHHTMQIYNKKWSRGQTQCPPGGRKCGDKTFSFFFFSPFFLEGRINVFWLLTVKYSSGKGANPGTGFCRYRSLCTLKWIVTFGNLTPSQTVGSGKTVWDGNSHFSHFLTLQSLGRVQNPGDRSGSETQGKCCSRVGKLEGKGGVGSSFSIPVPRSSPESWWCREDLERVKSFACGMSQM